MIVGFISLLLVTGCVKGIDPTMKQCPASTYSVLDHHQKNHVISTQSSHDVADCVIKCSEDLRCKSFNFGRQQKSCELNSADRYTHPEDFDWIPGYIYSETFVRHNKVRRKGGQKVEKRFTIFTKLLQCKALFWGLIFVGGTVA